MWTEESNSDIQKWKIAKFSFGNSVVIGPYAIVFEQYVPAYTNGNAKPFGMYLDDVYLKEGPCLPQGNCDFDHDLCKSVVLFLPREFDCITS